MSKLLLHRIENRHILWTALLTVAIGLIVPGGFGVKPPKWFDERTPQDVAAMTSFEPNPANISTSFAQREAAPNVKDELLVERTTQQYRTSSNRLRPN